MVRSHSTEDLQLKAVEQLTLTVNSLRSDVQRLQEKNTYFTQRLGPWYDRSSFNDGPQRRTHSPHLTFIVHSTDQTKAHLIDIPVVLILMSHSEKCTGCILCQGLTFFLKTHM